ncbi:hypothetical protein GCM10025864_22590 [Luteimicrobium album]|uniref:UDP-glucose 4-epimerase n=1 Tax=Luteimicrobium album TaxID=1054550 RepID=A0ABQ6I1F1_9MICO|nr:hypothetical protein GCM10025864_22590 [Luteimicrobium album]
MTWLVTGGAGYIGSHVVRAFVEAGIEPVVVDDLSSGHRAFVPDGTGSAPAVPFVEASILDTETLVATMRDHDVTGVVHLAGFKYAGESVKRPRHTYTQNVTGTVSLLDAMAQTDVTRIVFSSSAATYGTPDVDLVTEQTETHPESPYGESKLVGEWLLADEARAADATGGTPFRHTSLRYFNVVGSGSPDLYDTSPHNLFPLVLDALLEGRTPASTAPTTPRPTAPACATTCTSPTSPSRTSPPRRRSRRAASSRPSTTSAPATASPCGRSWTRWPA